MTSFRKSFLICLNLLLIISSTLCVELNSTTTLKVEDQIQSEKALETILSNPTSENINYGTITETDNDDEDETNGFINSMIENNNNTIAAIVENVATNITKNIKPDLEQVKIPVDIGDVLDKVTKQIFLFDENVKIPIDNTTNKWIQKVTRRQPKTYVPFRKLADTQQQDVPSFEEQPCWYNSYDNETSVSNSSENWVWIKAAFYELMKDFVVLDTDNEECRRHTEIYIEHVKNLTVWAMRMRDSSVLSPSGLLNTNYWHFGDFDECIGLNISDFGFMGRYCLPSVQFSPKKEYYPEFYEWDHERDYDPIDINSNAWGILRENKDPAKYTRDVINWGICIPSSCTTKDVRVALEKSFDQLSKKYPINFKVGLTEDKCYDETEREFPLGFYIFVGVFILLCTIVLLATFIDGFIIRTEFWDISPSIQTWIIPFSAATNLEKLCKNNESEEFSVIHGLKAITIVQVLMGHRQLQLFGSPLMNPSFQEERTIRLLWGYFTNGTLLTDTFFVIGGFLTFFYLYQELEERHGNINFPIIYIYRLLRITPVYMFVIFFYNYVLIYLGDGPLWDFKVGREVERCQMNWWTNLLYINNYYNEDQYCMIQTWYLSCDFHYFIVGTLIVYLCWRYRKLATPLFVSLLLFFTIMPSYIIYQGKYPAIFMNRILTQWDPLKDRMFLNVYIKSHLRALTYVMGMFFGYVYTRMKAVNYKIPWAWKWGICAVFGVIGHIPFLGGAVFYFPNRPYDALENAIFYSLQRIIWGSVIGWIIVGHASTRFGPLSKIVGHRIMVPLSRLVFCVYLVHVIFQLMGIGSMRSPVFLSYTNITFGMLQDLIVSFVAALVLNLLIESPLDRFQKNIVKKLIRGDSPFTKKAESKKQSIAKCNLSLGGESKTSEQPEQA